MSRQQVPIFHLCVSFLCTYPLIHLLFQTLSLKTFSAFDYIKGGSLQTFRECPTSFENISLFTP